MHYMIKTTLLSLAASTAYASDLGVPTNSSQFKEILKVSKLQMSDPRGKPGNKTDYASKGEFDGLAFITNLRMVKAKLISTS